MTARHGLPTVAGHERVVIVGNGNVALDVARVLTSDPDELSRTDIADHALKALRDSAVREVVIAARRGPAHSAFTVPELVGLTTASEVVLDADDHKLVERDLATAPDELTRAKLEILSNIGDASEPSSSPRVRLAYQLNLFLVQPFGEPAKSIERIRLMRLDDDANAFDRGHGYWAY